MFRPSGFVAPTRLRPGFVFRADMGFCYFHNQCARTIA